MKNSVAKAKKRDRVQMRMPEWKDGQPGCMTCLHELGTGSRVYQDQKTFVIYCAPCVEKKS